MFVRFCTITFLHTDEPRKRNISFVGTADYVPPELLGMDNNSTVSFPAMDFWSIGVLLYQCLYNITPFNAPNEYLTFKKIEEHNYEFPANREISDEAKDLISKFLNPIVNERLGMNAGFLEIKEHLFFIDHMSSLSTNNASLDEIWSWNALKTRKAPTYPATPLNSPVNDPIQARNRPSSAYMADGLPMDANVTPIDINVASNFSGAKNELEDEMKQSAKSSKSNSASDSQYDRWNEFLHSSEKIEMGSAVELSKMWGMSCEKYVMLLTNMRRILLIDSIKMQLKHDIPRSSIVECLIVDKHNFKLRQVKKNMKFRCIGATSQEWKKAFQKIC